MSALPSLERRPRSTSGYHLRAGAVPDLRFDMLVLSADPVVRQLCGDALPEAVSLVVVSSVRELRERLSTHTVVTGVLVDMELPRLDREDMMGALEGRWPCLPVLALLRSASRGALEAVGTLTHEYVLPQSPREMKVGTIRRFARQSFDARLETVARLLTFALRRGLRDTALDTFVAYAILQVPRSEFGEFFDLQPSGVEYRVKVLKNKLGGERTADIAQRLLYLPYVAPPPDLLMALETAAIRAVQG